MKKEIELARQAGWEYADDDRGFAPLWRFAELVRADEREAVIGLLKGIDKTEIESADGWWETSSGAGFGAGVLDAIRARTGEQK